MPASEQRSSSYPAKSRSGLRELQHGKRDNQVKMAIWKFKWGIGPWAADMGQQLGYSGLVTGHRAKHAGRASVSSRSAIVFLYVLAPSDANAAVLNAASMCRLPAGQGCKLGTKKETRKEKREGPGRRDGSLPLPVSSHKKTIEKSDEPRQAHREATEQRFYNDPLRGVVLVSVSVLVKDTEILAICFCRKYPFRFWVSSMRGWIMDGSMKPTATLRAAWVDRDHHKPSLL
ncbi:hypothetical protein B0T21DRAFT_388922 [Apiosordaria backusii]|uniref:Uncharacterized protein n=1 Tax=Apiosordaria backusii TaxID=314023 RepID=A0AA40EYM5_9PEZI|nr:hypothetical protein B0T21DRAFT_388922 [Apiosordaria backusii]